MRPQKMVTLDVEGVLIPEVWVNLAIRTGIDDLKRTTRDEPNYDKLMNERLEILDREGVTMGDLRAVDCNMLTLGQYLSPTPQHIPIERFVTPEEFEDLRVQGEAMGFKAVASGPFVRSSYHAGELLGPASDEARETCDGGTDGGA